MLKCRVWAAGGPDVTVGGSEDSMKGSARAEVMVSRQVVGTGRGLGVPAGILPTRAVLCVHEFLC